MTLDEIAEYICTRLLDEGIVIQRYDAFSTNSIYLKLDYGVLNSIRISDHRGKKHLKYRYNIGPFIKEYNKNRAGQIFYRVDKVKNLIRKVKKDRIEKMNKYGEQLYKNFMRDNIRENHGKCGFWQSAKLVKKED